MINKDAAKNLSAILKSVLGTTKLRIQYLTSGYGLHGWILNRWKFIHMNRSFHPHDVIYMYTQKDKGLD